MSTRQLRLFLFLLMIPFAGFSTNVGGTYTTNQNWTAAGNPYIVTSSVTMNPGTTLTVGTGVEVRFNSGTAMTIYGTMTATDAVFTTNLPTPATGSWATLTFGNGSAAGTSTITGCSFSWGTNTSISNLYTVNFNGSTITKFSGAPLTINPGGTFNSNNSTFTSSVTSISVSGTANFTNNSLISDIGGTTNSGINLHSGSLTLANSNITNCSTPLSINNIANLNISGTTDLSVNTSAKIKINFSSTSSGTFTLPTANVPYVFLVGFTVGTGSTLNIGSNNIIKFQIGYGLYVSGTLIADAAVGQSIFFTSYRDDNWGGVECGEWGCVDN